MHPIVSQVMAEDRIAQRHLEAARYRRSAPMGNQHDVGQSFRAAVARTIGALAAWVEPNGPGRSIRVTRVNEGTCEGTVRVHASHV